jgi:hypothetical protein
MVNRDILVQSKLLPCIHAVWADHIEWHSDLIFLCSGYVMLFPPVPP